MNYKQAKSQVQNDLHLNDILEELRRELPKKPKPTIAEVILILSRRMLQDAVFKHRAKMQTKFDFEAIELIKYFPIIWVIIIEDYSELCISEYAGLEDNEVKDFFNLLKQSCQKGYDEYMSGCFNLIKID